MARPPSQAEMERALLQGERQAELDQIEAETDIIAQLQQKLDELENAIQREKDKVEREQRVFESTECTGFKCCLFLHIL